MSPEQAQQRIQTEAHNDFPFPSFPTPPPSKGEDELKISSASAKKSSQNNNSWSYEDQFKQVRQVSERLELPFNCAVSINNSPLSRLLFGARAGIEGKLHVWEEIGILDVLLVQGAQLSEKNSYISNLCPKSLWNPYNLNLKEVKQFSCS